MTRGKEKMSKRRREVRRKKRQLLISGALLLFLVCFFGGLYYWLYQYVHKVPANVILDNVCIGAADVSGMTAEEAAEALNIMMAQYEGEQFNFQIDEETNVEVLYRDMGITYNDTDAYITAALAYGREGSLWSCFGKIRELKDTPKIIGVDYIIDGDRTEALLTEKVVPLEQPAVNAGISRNDGQFEYTDEQEGWKVNITETIRILEEYLDGEDIDFSSGTITVAKTTDTPKITVADLETIQDVLGTFGTEAGGGDRWNNLKTGAAAIDGTVVMPGEEVSAYDMTAPYTPENGYYEASAYENGQVVASIAGGICQVSTTLYNAVINAELEVTQRAPHSMLVSYVKPSRDAAIAGDYKDLKFKNNYDTPIYIQSFIDDNNILTMTIYGKDIREEGRELIFTSETIKNVEPEGEPKYVASSDKSIGYMEQTQSRRSGMEARLIKTVKVNGQVVSEDTFNTSTYNASAGVVTVGTGSYNSDAVSVMKTAIATQNGEKIKQAIQQAQAMIQQADASAAADQDDSRDEETTDAGGEANE